MLVRATKENKLGLVWQSVPVGSYFRPSVKGSPSEEVSLEENL